MFHLITVKISTLIIKFIHTTNSALLDALKLYLLIKKNLKVLLREMKLMLPDKYGIHEKTVKKADGSYRSLPMLRIRY